MTHKGLILGRPQYVHKVVACTIAFLPHGASRSYSTAGCARPYCLLHPVSHPVHCTCHRVSELGGQGADRAEGVCMGGCIVPCSLVCFAQLLQLRSCTWQWVGACIACTDCTRCVDSLYSTILCSLPRSCEQGLCVKTCHGMCKMKVSI